MKVRLAKKIGKVTFAFNNFDSNYQPYSMPQQRKAVKVVTRKCSKEVRELLLHWGIVKKVPLKYRKYKGFIPAEFVW